MKPPACAAFQPVGRALFSPLGIIFLRRRRYVGLLYPHAGKIARGLGTFSKGSDTIAETAISSYHKGAIFVLYLLFLPPLLAAGLFWLLRLRGQRVRQALSRRFIDEILRGTNTAERIAASTAVLEALQGKRMLVMAATHDLELTHMPGYENWHFEESLDAGRVVFPYRLCAGPSHGHTAIALMRQLGFDDAIVRHAEENVISASHACEKKL